MSSVVFELDTDEHNQRGVLGTLAVSGDVRCSLPPTAGDAPDLRTLPVVGGNSYA